MFNKSENGFATFDDTDDDMIHIRLNDDVDTYKYVCIFNFQPVEAGHEHNFIPTDVNTFPVKRENGK